MQPRKGAVVPSCRAVMPSCRLASLAFSPPPASFHHTTCSAITADSMLRLAFVASDRPVAIMCKRLIMCTRGFRSLLAPSLPRLHGMEQLLEVVVSAWWMLESSAG